MNKLVTFYDASFDKDDFNNTMLASKTQPGLMSSDDKVKLDSLSSGGSASPNPVNAKDILVDSEHCFVTDEQKASWTAKPETKEDIGLSNVTNDAQVKRSELGVAGGVATLDESGLIPSAFLPGFVDDVIEADSANSFPAQGETGKLYVSTSENKTYRWSGSSYIEITSGLALGETSATAYAGDKGKAIADTVDAITNGTTIVPKATDASTVSGFTVAKAVPADAVFTDTVYVHPETHPATIITEDEIHKFVSDEQIAKWDAKANEIHREPYYDASVNAVFACGVGVRVEASDTANKTKITWQDVTGTRGIEVPVTADVFGGGYGKDKVIYYAGSSVTMNSGKVNRVCGGCLSNGTVGDATVVINGGTITNGVNGGGCAYNDATKKSSTNTVGHAEVVINNTDAEILIVYGGGQGYSTVGSAKVTVNGGAINYLTAGGSNGHTSVGEVTVNGGTIKVLQGCNRGSMANIKLNINGGTVNKVYAGGETEDKSVTATYVKSEVYISGGTITHIYDGTNNGVEDASKVSGTYADGVVSDDEAAKMNLVKEPKYALELEGKTLVLKLGDKVVTSIDLSSING